MAARKPPKKPKGKREPRPAGKPRAKVPTRYEELAAEWQRRKNDPDRGSGNWMVDKPELATNAARFLKTLRRLGYVMQDQRCFDLHRDLIRSGMIDLATGKWTRHGTVLANPDTRMICEAIKEATAPGVPERELLAEAVVELNLKAANFDAAVERLRQLFHAYRKVV